MSAYTLTYEEILAEIGDLLGYGPDEDQWTEEELKRIKRIFGSGLRQFYAPKSHDGVYIHRWSFLRKYHEDEIGEEGEPGDGHEIAAPDDFRALLGSVFINDNTRSEILVMPPFQFQRLRMSPTYHSEIGRPIRCAVMHDGSNGMGSYKLAFYPRPNQVYPITFEYEIDPPKVEEGQLPAPLSEHSETILESCLSIAEQRPGEAISTIHTMKYAQALAVSIERDLTHHGGSRMGNIIDPSNDLPLDGSLGDTRMLRHGPGPPVTREEFL